MKYVIELIPKAFTCLLLLKVVPHTLPKQTLTGHIADGKKPLWIYGRILGKGCEKRSLYSIYILFGAAFSTSLLSCIPYGTEMYLRLPQNLRWSFRLAALDLLQLSCLFSSTLTFSKSSGNLVSLTDYLQRNIWCLRKLKFQLYFTTLSNSTHSKVLFSDNFKRSLS